MPKHLNNKAHLLLQHKRQIMGLLSMVSECVDEAEVELFVSKRFGIFRDGDITALPPYEWEELYQWSERWFENQDCDISKEAEQIITCIFMALENAERDIQLYLNCSEGEIPDSLSAKVIELALVLYQSSNANNNHTAGAKSYTYSEGDVSQSVTYMTAQDVQTAKDSILKSIAHYRRRARWRC